MLSLCVQFVVPSAYFFAKVSRRGERKTLRDVSGMSRRPFCVKKFFPRDGSEYRSPLSVVPIAITPLSSISIELRSSFCPASGEMFFTDVNGFPSLHEISAMPPFPTAMKFPFLSEEISEILKGTGVRPIQDSLATLKKYISPIVSSRLLLEKQTVSFEMAQFTPRLKRFMISEEGVIPL